MYFQASEKASDANNHDEKSDEFQEMRNRS